MFFVPFSDVALVTTNVFGAESVPSFRFCVALRSGMVPSALGIVSMVFVFTLPVTVAFPYTFKFVELVNCCREAVPMFVLSSVVVPMTLRFPVREPLPRTDKVLGLAAVPIF